MAFKENILLYQSVLTPLDIWALFHSQHLHFHEWKVLTVDSNFRFIQGPIHNNPAFVQMMAWWLTGDKPLPEPILTQVTSAMMHWGFTLFSTWSFIQLWPNDACMSDNWVIIDTYNGFQFLQCDNLNKCWLVVNRTHRSNRFWKLVWKVFIEDNTFEMSAAKQWPDNQSTSRYT